MASYNRIRAAKQSPIGTIMPWAGSSSSSSLAEDAVPFGYIVCRGQTLLARDYPLLAQLIGNTYGPFQEPGGPPTKCNIYFFSAISKICTYVMKIVWGIRIVKIKGRKLFF